MPLINFQRREISCKLVYYGPGLSGKTTNLQVVHKKAPESKKGPLTSIATEGDRTLFFDYMPLNLGSLGGLTTKFQLYTVPGQPYYNATRKLVLRGADGIVFVADSQKGMLERNKESFANLEENLRNEGIDPARIPIVLQWNKRDLPDAEEIEVLDRELNKYDCPSIEAAAIRGEGVFPTLRKVARLVLDKLHDEYNFMAHRKARDQRAKVTAARKAESTPPQDEPELVQAPRLPDPRCRELPPREVEADGPQLLPSDGEGRKVVGPKVVSGRMFSTRVAVLLVVLSLVALCGAAWGGYLSQLEALLSSLR